MKRSITASLVFVSLIQSAAQANLMDLPDPSADDGGSTAQTPVTPTRNEPVATTPATQYAGSLRLEKVSRKTGGQVYKVDLTESYRLQKVDVRVATSRLKIHRAILITESGSQITLQQLNNAAVIETSAVLSSETLRSNDRIKTIELTLEGYGGDTDVIVTAVADAGVPKLSLRQDAPPVVQQPVKQNPVTQTPEQPVLNPYNPNDQYEEPSRPGRGSVDYYGQRFKVGETALYGTSLVTVVWIYKERNSDEVMVRFTNGQQAIAYSYELTKEAACTNGLCKGVRVVNQYGERGTVLGNFEGNIILVNYGNYVTSHYSNELTIERTQTRPNAKTRVQCSNDRRICVGDSVHHPQGYVMTVSAIYSDGTADVYDQAGRETLRVNSLRPVRRGGGSIIRW